jgi:hypothetical protein
MLFVSTLFSLAAFLQKEIIKINVKNIYSSGCDIKKFCK